MSHNCPTCRIEFKNWGALLNHFKYRCTSTPEERFWARVERTRGCWRYKGALNKDGYGTLNVNGSLISAHRYAWLLTFGDPGKKWVLHTCDVRNCCNPKHLYLGDRKDNIRDMDSRGRRGHRYMPVDELLFPHLSQRGRGGRGRFRKDKQF